MQSENIHREKSLSRIKSTRANSSESAELSRPKFSFRHSERPSTSRSRVDQFRLRQIWAVSARVVVRQKAADESRSWIAEVWAAGSRRPAGLGLGLKALTISSAWRPPRQPVVPQCSGPSVLAWQRVVLRCAARHRAWMPGAQAAASGRWKLQPRLTASSSERRIAPNPVSEPRLPACPLLRRRRIASQAWRRHR